MGCNWVGYRTNLRVRPRYWVASALLAIGSVDAPATRAHAEIPGHVSFYEMQQLESFALSSSCVAAELAPKGKVSTARILGFDLFQDSEQCRAARFGQICKTVARRLNTDNCSHAFYIGSVLTTVPLNVALKHLHEIHQTAAIRRATKVIESSRKQPFVWAGDGRDQGVFIVETAYGLFVIDLGE